MAKYTNESQALNCAIKQLFEFFDKPPTDTKISMVAELDSATKPPSPNNRLGVFKIFDSDGDGKISVEELTSALRSSSTEISQMQEAKSKYSKIDDSERVFKYFDTNGDGFITADELASVLEAVGGTKDEFYALLGDSDDGYDDDIRKAFEVYDDMDENNNQFDSMATSLIEKIQLNDLDCK